MAMKPIKGDIKMITAAGIVSNKETTKEDTTTITLAQNWRQHRTHETSRFRSATRTTWDTNSSADPSWPDNRFAVPTDTPNYPLQPDNGPPQDRIGRLF